MCTFISFGLYYCTQALVELERQPLELRIDTLTYDAREVDFPALAFCPDQALDELNLAAVLLDQVTKSHLHKPVTMKQKMSAKTVFTSFEY